MPRQTSVSQTICPHSCWCDLVASSSVCPMKLSLRPPALLEPHLHMPKRVSGMALVGSSSWEKDRLCPSVSGSDWALSSYLKIHSCGPGFSSRADLLSYVCLPRFCPCGTLEGVPSQALSTFLVFVSFLCNFDECVVFFFKKSWSTFFCKWKMSFKKMGMPRLKDAAARSTIVFTSEL